MEIMFHGQMGEQSIAEKPFWKDSRRARGEGAVTVVTVALLQFIAHDFLSHRVHVNNGSGFTALGVQRPPAVRTTLRLRHRLLAGELVAGDVAPAVAAMTRLGPAPALRASRRRIGFKWDFGRRSRGAKGTFLGGPFLAAQTSFEATDFCLQPVDEQLRFQTPRAKARLEFRKIYSGVGDSRCWRCWRKSSGPSW
jgi:hypothetical protein